MVQVRLLCLNQGMPRSRIVLLVYLEVLGTGTVQSLYQHTYGQAVDVHSGQVTDVSFLIVIRSFVNQTDIGQLVEDILCQPDGNLMLFAQLFCRIGLLLVLEPLADSGEHDGTEEIVVAPADMRRFFPEAERRKVLADVAHLGTEQADGP